MLVPSGGRHLHIFFGWIYRGLPISVEFDVYVGCEIDCIFYIACYMEETKNE